ncbi:hypothetical protein XPU_1945 [Xanthomonas arboricola pv. pruni str. MAFF 311562]|uniref:50S ribosomal protein L19 n=1 Tax=Xanthomonas arboricola pv. pruni str. MAFF 311562 TaxID=1414836 RepID=W4S2P7_9XANT|nr:hypothetical protein XPU_1945 [Xanthomonas arboricola pv. pruni str. MAFF 311562]GAE59667.1 hypothetical protein XPN_1573 [Xanthomonas arboricola pv. pruni MAFF 301427]
MRLAGQPCVWPSYEPRAIAVRRLPVQYHQTRGAHHEQTQKDHPADFEAAQIQRKLPEFNQGDTVVVNVKVKEGNRERVQAYEAS